MDTFRPHYEITYHANGRMKQRECRYATVMEGNAIIDTSKPSIEEWYEDGQKKFEAWHSSEGWQKGWHRLDGAARTRWYKTGQIEKIEYYVYGKPHRIGGPAIQEFHIDGTPKSESWYKNWKFHRLDGPAYITKNTEWWCIDGNRSEHLFIDICNTMGLPPISQWREWSIDDKLIVRLCLEI